MKTKKIMGLTALMLLATLLLVITPQIVQVVAPTEDTAQGSFTLNATPSVSGVDFQDDSYVTDSALDPVTVWQRLNFTVSSSAGMTDILNCTIWIFDDSTHGANYNETAEDGIFLVQFLWIEATDTWTVNDQGSMSEWAVDNSNSDDPGSASSETSFDFSMRFNISQVARAEASDWNASVHVYDDDAGGAEWDYSSETALVTMNNYFSVDYSASTFDWGTLQPNTVNDTHPSLTVTVYANAQWELQINATDFNATDESDVDIEAQNILCWDADGSEGGSSFWIRNTIATATDSWDNQGPMSDESGLSRDCFYFLSTGTYFDAGVGKTWSTWVTVWVQANA